MIDTLWQLVKLNSQKNTTVNIESFLNQYNSLQQIKLVHINFLLKFRTKILTSMISQIITSSLL